MISTLKLQAEFGRFDEDEEPEKWYRSIEIDLETNLEDLHHCIQAAIGFDNDHLYEFFIANTTRSPDRTRFNDENRGLWDYSVADLFPLPKNKKLFYLFDFGDSWHFRISKSPKRARNPEAEVVYPRVTEIVGDNPEQYPD